MQHTQSIARIHAFAYELLNSNTKINAFIWWLKWAKKERNSNNNSEIWKRAIRLRCIRCKFLSYIFERAGSVHIYTSSCTLILWFGIASVGSFTTKCLLVHSMATRDTDERWREHVSWVCVVCVWVCEQKRKEKLALEGQSIVLHLAATELLWKRKQTFSFRR